MRIVHRHFDTIDSTNTWAKHNAHLLSHDDLTLVTSDSQTAGRGRFKRQWVSPPGQNIYASFCFFIEKHHLSIGNIPQIMAISAAKCIEGFGFSPYLKWPNDVLLSQKKVAGILAETTPLSDHLCMIIGIGLNVNMPLEDLKAIDRPATSMLAEAGHQFNVNEVLEKLQQHFLNDLTLFMEEGFHPFLSDYRGRLPVSKNQTVRFHDNRTIWEGHVEAINDDGSLLFRLMDGTAKTFVAGEILWSGE